MSKASEVNFETTKGSTLSRLKENKLAPIEAIPTPFRSWNAICGEEGGLIGIARKWMVTVGGITGTGKSYFVLNLAAHAVRMGKRVGMINIEMTQMAVATRFLTILTGIPKYKMEMGKNFSQDLWDAAHRKADEIFEETGGTLITNESTVFSLEDVEESYRQLADAGCTMIILDYAQLVGVAGVTDIFKRSEQVAYKLRELTHKYNVTTLCVSQLKRADTKNRGKAPSIHDLMGGGCWEQVSHQIWLLNHTYRKKFGERPNGFHSGEYTEVLCGKNRSGIAPFDLPLRWTYENMRFDEQADVGGDERHAVEITPEPECPHTGELFEEDYGSEP